MFSKGYKCHELVPEGWKEEVQSIKKYNENNKPNTNVLPHKKNSYLSHKNIFIKSVNIHNFNLNTPTAPILKVGTAYTLI